MQAKPRVALCPPPQAQVCWCDWGSVVMEGYARGTPARRWEGAEGTAPPPPPLHPVQEGGAARRPDPAVWEQTKQKGRTKESRRLSRIQRRNTTKTFSPRCPGSGGLASALLAATGCPALGRPWPRAWGFLPSRPAPSAGTAAQLQRGGLGEGFLPGSCSPFLPVSPIRPIRPQRSPPRPRGRASHWGGFEHSPMRRMSSEFPGDAGRVRSQSPPPSPHTQAP